VKTDNLSLRRRHLIIAGLAGIAAPAGIFAASDNTNGAESTARPLIVSGRLMDSDGKPVAGALVAAAHVSTTTDADGRFVFATVTNTLRNDGPQSLACRVSHPVHGSRDHKINLGRASIQRDDAGAWRAAVGLHLT
jgi:hypothetical protein